MKGSTAAGVLVIIVVSALASGAGVLCQTRQAEPQPSRNPRSPASIGGLVIGTSGEPVAGVQVSLSELNKLDFMRARQTTTAGDGTFEFENVARGVYTVTAYRMDWPSQSTCRPGDSVTLRVSTNKRGVVTGRVTDTNGKPAIEAPVHAIRLRDSEGHSSIPWGRPFEGLTDDRGIYRIWGLPAGTYVLSAGAGSFSYGEPRPYDKEPQTYFPSNSAATATEVTVNAADEQTGLDIRMRDWNAHAISGKVSGSPGHRPDQSYFAVILWEASTSRIEAMGQPNTEQATGEFKFETLAAGDYCLQALEGKEMEPTGASAVMQVTLGDSDITGLDLIVRQGAAFSGRILIEPLSQNAAKTCAKISEPVMAETLISLYPERQPRQDVGRKCQPSSSLLNMVRGATTDGIARATPDVRGEVSIKPLESGRYRIGVEPPNENYYLKSVTLPRPGSKLQVDIGRNGMEIKDGASVSGIVITLAPGAASLSGSVVPPAGAKLPSGIIVLLVPADPQAQDDVLRFDGSPVTSGGAFNFKNVAPGRYSLVVRSDLSGSGGDAVYSRPWWDANTRAELRREAERANALVDLKTCDRVKSHVLVYSAK